MDRMNGPNEWTDGPNGVSGRRDPRLVETHRRERLHRPGRRGTAGQGRRLYSHTTRFFSRAQLTVRLDRGGEIRGFSLVVNGYKKQTSVKAAFELWWWCE